MDQYFDHHHNHQHHHYQISKGKDDGPMREETRQRKRAFDFLKVLILL